MLPPHCLGNNCSGSVGSQSLHDSFAAPVHCVRKETGGSAGKLLGAAGVGGQAEWDY